MNKAQEQKSINATRSEFEKSFREGQYYNKQTRDEEHLTVIKSLLTLQDGMKILDLGTGTGFLSFDLAKSNSNVKVVGLDIVKEALQKNREKAETEGITNIEFITYNGGTFPFEDQQFDLVVTRFALHHFPNIKSTFHEIERVLKVNGKLMISDPTPNEEDTERFVDAYMQMKKDGHIKFYRKEELIDLLRPLGLHYENDVVTSIRFPKKRETAIGFEEIMEKYDQSIIDGYNLEITNEEIYITEKVLNILFKKNDKAVDIK